MYSASLVIVSVPQFLKSHAVQEGRCTVGKLTHFAVVEEWYFGAQALETSHTSSRRGAEGQDQCGFTVVASLRQGKKKKTAMGIQVEGPHSRVLEAWYMDDSSEDQRLPHRLNPNVPVSEKALTDLGVTQWVLDADKFENDPELEQIRKDRNYNYQDIITVSPEKLANYEVKLKSFFEEHIHTDEEIRYVLEGGGYFDVRDKEDRWIRIWTKKGDMIVLPAGIYHRFTLDEGNFIKAMRLFIGEPIWTPYNRPQDSNPVREGYVDSFLKPLAGTTVAAH